MKKLIMLVIITGILLLGYLICFSAVKNIVYEQDTKIIKGIVIKTMPATDTDKIDIICEKNKIIYGANQNITLIFTVDEKTIPSDIMTKLYKIDIITKDIYEPITIEYISGYKIKNIKREIIGRLTLSSGTTYNIYDMKGTKLGTYKASIKLTTINIKGKEYKLIKIGTSYTIKE